MTKLEALHKYLSGWTSNQSFRKWLLELNNDDHFFSAQDFTQLKVLAIIFSNPNKIKNILQNYVDKSIVDKLVLTKKFKKLVEKDEDILNKLDELNSLGKQLGNTDIITFVNLYIGLFQNIPYLTERKNWKVEIFLEKRREIEKRRKEIMDKIIKFNEDYYYEYKK